MRHGKRQMHGVRRDCGRDDLLVKKTCDQRIHFRRDAKARQTIQHGKPFGGKISVTFGGFFQHGFRNEQVLFVPVNFPPSLRGFLIRCESQVATGSRHQVARNSRFDVEPRLHF